MILPGEAHPAIEACRDLLATVPTGTTPVHYAVSERPYVSRWNEPPLRQLTFTRTKAWHSLYPELGAYVWDVWTDQYGRSVAPNPARWVDAPDAIMRAPFNPVAEDRQ